MPNIQELMAGTYFSKLETSWQTIETFTRLHAVGELRAMTQAKLDQKLCFETLGI